MSLQKPPLIIKISPSTAIFDCVIYSNGQINFYLTQTAKVQKLTYVIPVTGHTTE